MRKGPPGAVTPARVAFGRGFGRGRLCGPALSPLWTWSFVKGGPRGSAAPAPELETAGKPFIPGGGGRPRGSTGHHLGSLLPKGRLHAGSSALPESASICPGTELPEVRRSTRPFLAHVPSESPSHPPHPVTPFVTFGTICNLGGRQHFPGGSAGKESASSAGDLGSVPGLGRSPGEGKGYPVQHSGLENPMVCVVHEVTKSRTRLSDFQLSLSRLSCRTRAPPC